MGWLAGDEAEATLGGLRLERGRGDGGESTRFKRGDDPVRLAFDHGAVGREPLEADVDRLAEIGAVTEIELDARITTVGLGFPRGEELDLVADTVIIQLGRETALGLGGRIVDGVGRRQASFKLVAGLEDRGATGQETERKKGQDFLHGTRGVQRRTTG